MDANHFLDLTLGSGAIAGQGFLDFIRRVFVDGEVFLFGGEKNDTTGFGDGDAGGDVFGEE